MMPFWYRFIISGCRSVVLIGILCLGVVTTAYAAVGCTLNDPDRDIKRLFPDATGYRTEFITIEERGGESLRQRIEEQLQDTLDVLYEAIDVPYAYYSVLRGRDLIGYVHGVNQKGMYGGIQLILATDLQGRIIDFYYQKISSPEAKKFKDKGFTGQFIGLVLDDFLNNTISIADPSTASSQDFKATLRGIRKNLILLKEFKAKKTEGN